MPKDEPRRCFVIGPIGPVGSEIRARSDCLLRELIAPAVEAHEYEVIRADQISDPGMITTQIVEHVVFDALVVADLTEHNPNVFYELALRHASKQPVLTLIEAGQRVPFDLSGFRAIEVVHTDTESVLEARKQLAEQVGRFDGSRTTQDSPVSVALRSWAFRTHPALIPQDLVRDLIDSACWARLALGPREPLNEDGLDDARRYLEELERDINRLCEKTGHLPTKFFYHDNRVLYDAIRGK